MEGKLIVVDGCDFTGKSTQVQNIATFFRKHNIKHVITREPGGTPFGEEMRSIIFEKGKNLHPYTELMLFLASRAEHIHTKIKPMLKQGICVICDRFTPSTFVYQGVLRGILSEEIITMHNIILKETKPDITFIFDLSPKQILERMEENMFRGFNSYDSKAVSDITKIRNGFLEFTKITPCKVIDASGTSLQVYQTIESELKNLLQTKA